MLLHHLDGQGGDSRIRETLLPDERSAHGGHHGYEGLVCQIFRLQEGDPVSLSVELSEVQESVVGITAPAGPENPCTGGQGLQVLFTYGTEIGHSGGSPPVRERDGRKMKGAACSQQETAGNGEAGGLVWTLPLPGA
jgi:hypothetical protein